MLPLLLLLNTGISGLFHFNDWSRNQEFEPRYSDPAGPPILCPPQSGPIIEIVVTCVCTVQPSSAYQVFACSRSSSALNARAVAEYPPAVDPAVGPTKIPTFD